MQQKQGWNVQKKTKKILLLIKKKRPCIKTQIVAEKKTKKILCTFFSEGRNHDFRIFKESKLKLVSSVKILADGVYKGIEKIHKNVQLPHKKTKGNPLKKEKKRENQSLSRKRIVIENSIGLLKRFKIIADKYRNRRKRFGLRFNLIAAIYNLELSI